MRRFEDWPTRLHGFIAENSDRLFQYGYWDCCLFACGAIEAMTGEDIALPFRGKYSTRRGAFDIAQQYCGERSIETLAAKVASENGMPETTPNLARRGDLVLIERPFGHSAGIVALNGSQIFITGELSRNGGSGLGFVPISRAVRAWRV